MVKTVVICFLNGELLFDTCKIKFSQVPNEVQENMLKLSVDIINTLLYICICIYIYIYISVKNEALLGFIFRKGLIISTRILKVYT